MQHRFTIKAPYLLGISTLVAVYSMIGPIASRAAEVEATGSVDVEVAAGTTTNVIVTLYHDGKPVALQDISANQGPDGRGGYTFHGVPMGPTEVRIEAAGFVTVNRLAILRSPDPDARVLVKMEKGQGAVTISPGPSIQELEARIKKLEEARK